jgi:hypothetical protein
MLLNRSLYPSWLRSCCFSILLLLCYAVGIVQDAQGQQVVGANKVVSREGVLSAMSQSTYDFFIPAQALASALDHYAAQIRLPLVYSGELVFGKTSSLVQGRYTAQDALGLLLSGTGVVAQYTSTSAGEMLTLERQKEELEHDGLPDEKKPIVSGIQAFQGHVQQRVLQALCRNTLTLPGAYDVLLRFKLNAQGAVYQVQLLDTTGNTVRDATLKKTLQQLQTAPPPSMLQDKFLTMAIAKGAQAGEECN